VARPGPVTRKDVAARAGVSAAVVSYVVNDVPHSVSPVTRARVEQAIQELGYYPNELARSLRRQQSLTIGLRIPNLTNAVYAKIARIREICTSWAMTTFKALPTSRLPSPRCNSQRWAWGTGQRSRSCAWWYRKATWHHKRGFCPSGSSCGLRPPHRCDGKRAVPLEIREQT